MQSEPMSVEIINKDNIEDLSEEEIIRQVAEEEGMTYEEVKEIWEIFKSNVPKKQSATKKKFNKVKAKSKKKQSKITRKKNR